SDMREVIDAMNEGHMNARLAFNVYCYRLRKYIGAYTAAMGGLDVLVFTAGAGENSPEVRAASCQKLEFLGVKLDEEKNRVAIGKEMDISADDASVRTLVIPTNEELVIALDTERIVKEKQAAK
ncbi:MAG: acetate kinase, partial [Candidatus Zixiibacteriota bacterium]